MVDERVPLNRERVLSCAMEIADARGLAALTMRSLAEALGVKPMSLYHHVTNKDEILDGIVDLVFAEIELPSAAGDWRREIRRRTGSARLVLRRHPWAITLLESRATPGPATLQHHDAVLGTLRAAGMSVPMTAHAYALLDAYIYGFAVQESALPFTSDNAAEVAGAIMEHFPAETYPHLAELAIEHVLRPGYDFGDEFEFGLGLILDALERALDDGGRDSGVDVAASSAPRRDADS